MSRRVLLLWTLVAMAGCKDKWDKALAEAEVFKDRMCACKDKACVDDVKKERLAWDASLKERRGKDETPPDKVMERAKALLNEMGACEMAVEKAAAAKVNAVAIRKLTDIKDQMCACKDSACANKLNDEMTKWNQEQDKSDPAAVLFDEESQKKMTELTKQLTDCMTRAMTP
jgi:hypothetical protein